ncbi:hypothetical protein [Actinoplanes sp. GCM10030250]|uniref:hypothetical protein n=1 Tax=Actinoplanes sp. GCM10030250 TaxID=3273376 RepID=UPI00361A1384
MSYPLVAEAADSTTGISGLGLVEDVRQITDGIRSREWVDTSLGGLGVSMEALSLAFDPLSGLVSWGVGWLMEHVRPLQDALDWLAGDGDEVAAHAATWENVAAVIGTARVEYAERLHAEAAGWFGASADAYRAHAGEHLAVLEGLTTAATGISSAVEGTGLLVGLVREIVRDLIAEFVATLAARLPQWLAAEGLTLGIATPLVAGQVASLVAAWATRIQHFIMGLLASLRRLLPGVTRLEGALGGLLGMAEQLARAKPLHRAEPGPGSGSVAGGHADGSPSSSALPPPGPPWRGRDDIAGPARGKDLDPPNNRHTLAGVKHGLVRPENSVILRGNEDAVRGDVREIAAGNAAWNPQTGRYEINGRSYGIEPSGTVFPDSGPGIARLDRNEYAALREIARADGDVEKVAAFQRDPRFLNNPEAIVKAKSIYDGTYTP